MEFQQYNSAFTSGSYESRWGVTEHSRAYYLSGTITILYRWKRDMAPASRNPHHTIHGSLEQYDSTIPLKKYFATVSRTSIRVLLCSQCTYYTTCWRMRHLQSFQNHVLVVRLNAFAILPSIVFSQLRK